MIKFDSNSEKPIKEIEKLYETAIKFGQHNPEAFVVSTSMHDKPSARFVNIKQIDNNQFIFFSNYESRKAKEIENNNNVAGIFYWSSINCQIRIEGKIIKLNPEQSDLHFRKRSYEKNIAAISSNQSKVINSYEEVKKTYEENLQKFLNKNISRPKNWGGYSLSPNIIEIWIGKENRLNHRKRYTLEKADWKLEILEP